MPRVPSVQECANLCDEVAHCASFTYNPVNRKCKRRCVRNFLSTTTKADNAQFPFSQMPPYQGVSARTLLPTTCTLQRTLFSSPPLKLQAPRTFLHGWHTEQNMQRRILGLRVEVFDDVESYMSRANHLLKHYRLSYRLDCWDRIALGRVFDWARHVARFCK